jgi:hypothetical protein
MAKSPAASHVHGTVQRPPAFAVGGRDPHFVAEVDDYGKRRYRSQSHFVEESIVRTCA